MLPGSNLTVQQELSPPRGVQSSDSHPQGTHISLLKDPPLETLLSSAFQEIKLQTESVKVRRRQTCTPGSHLNSSKQQRTQRLLATRGPCVNKSRTCLRMSSELVSVSRKNNGTWPSQFGQLGAPGRALQPPTTDLGSLAGLYVPGKPAEPGGRPTPGRLWSKELKSQQCPPGGGRWAGTKSTLFHLSGKRSAFTSLVQ